MSKTYEISVHYDYEGDYLYEIIVTKNAEIALKDVCTTVNRFRGVQVELNINDEEEKK